MAQDQPNDNGSSHVAKVLKREVLACDDPICSCEAEPRWLLFEQEAMGQADPSEWESLSRPPNAEL